MKKILLAVVVTVLVSVLPVRAQMVAANVDALWLATLTPNVGFELVVGERSTVSLNSLFASLSALAALALFMILHGRVRCMMVRHWVWG